jgi:hypothetical protein
MPLGMPQRSLDGRVCTAAGAFEAGCASRGRTCRPLWTTHLHKHKGPPTVPHGVVYVGTIDGNLFPYAADCATDGRACTPLWVATGSGGDPANSEGIWSALVVVNGALSWPTPTATCMSTSSTGALRVRREALRRASGISSSGSQV